MIWRRVIYRSDWIVKSWHALGATPAGSTPFRRAAVRYPGVPLCVPSLWAGGPLSAGLDSRGLAAPVGVFGSLGHSLVMELGMKEVMRSVRELAPLAWRACRTAVEVGALIMLLDVVGSGGVLPADDSWLATVVGMELAQWASIRGRVLLDFRVDDERGELTLGRGTASSAGKLSVLTTQVPPAPSAPNQNDSFSARSASNLSVIVEAPAHGAGELSDSQKVGDADVAPPAVCARITDGLDGVGGAVAERFAAWRVEQSEAMLSAAFQRWRKAGRQVPRDASELIHRLARHPNVTPDVVRVAVRRCSDSGRTRVAGYLIVALGATYDAAGSPAGVPLEPGVWDTAGLQAWREYEGRVLAGMQADAARRAAVAPETAPVTGAGERGAEPSRPLSPGNLARWNRYIERKQAVAS